jgi:hypothetical protein
MGVMCLFFKWEGFDFSLDLSYDVNLNKSHTVKSRK